MPRDLKFYHQFSSDDQIIKYTKCKLYYELGSKPYSKIYPFIKVGAGAVEHTFQNTEIDKKSGLALKADFGLNFDFWKCLGLQAGLNYQAYEKMAERLSNAQAFNPYVAVLFRFGGVDESQTLQNVEGSPAVPAKNVTSVVVSPEFKDQDNDGVADADDKCANTKTGLKVNSFGCTTTEKVEIAVNVNFAPGKAEITPDTLGEVKKLADFMRKYKETTVLVSGHTDSTGSRKVNLAVSESRAKAVQSELIKLGVEKNRITAKGFGPDQPVADNKTQSGKMANRRVVAEIKADIESKSN